MQFYSKSIIDMDNTDRRLNWCRVVTFQSRNIKNVVVTMYLLSLLKDNVCVVKKPRWVDLCPKSCWPFSQYCQVLSTNEEKQVTRTTPLHFIMNREIVSVEQGFRHRAPMTSSFQHEICFNELSLAFEHWDVFRLDVNRVRRVIKMGKLLLLCESMS